MIQSGATVGQHTHAYTHTYTHTHTHTHTHIHTNTQTHTHTIHPSIHTAFHSISAYGSGWVFLWLACSELLTTEFWYQNICTSNYPSRYPKLFLEHQTHFQQSTFHSDLNNNRCHTCTTMLLDKCLHNSLNPCCCRYLCREFWAMVVYQGIYSHCTISCYMECVVGWLSPNVERTIFSVHFVPWKMV